MKNVLKEKDIDLISVMEEQINKCRRQLQSQWVKNTRSILVVEKMKIGMNKNLLKMKLNNFQEWDLAWVNKFL